MDPTTTFICTILYQRSDTKSSIYTGGNPGHFFNLHWYDLLNISCSFDLNTPTAYILNLRGSDIPYNPLFHSYLFVGLDNAVLFVETSKVQDDVASYLKEIDVQLRPYTDLWPFLRRREWGEGKVSFILAIPFWLGLNPNLLFYKKGSHRTSNLVCHLAHVDTFPLYIGAISHRTNDVP